MSVDTLFHLQYQRVECRIFCRWDWAAARGLVANTIEECKHTQGHERPINACSLGLINYPKKETEVWGHQRNLIRTRCITQSLYPHSLSPCLLFSAPSLFTEPSASSENINHLWTSGRGQKDRFQVDAAALFAQVLFNGGSTWLWLVFQPLRVQICLMRPPCSASLGAEVQQLPLKSTSEPFSLFWHQLWLCFKNLSEIQSVVGGSLRWQPEYKWADTDEASHRCCCCKFKVVARFCLFLNKKSVTNNLIFVAGSLQHQVIEY